ncbi:Uncharacterised protein [uncultured archaeon]|nr:Uncharacterised protein [uncultured archaeon]
MRIKNAGPSDGIGSERDYSLAIILAAYQIATNTPSARARTPARTPCNLRDPPCRPSESPGRPPRAPAFPPRRSRRQALPSQAHAPAQARRPALSQKLQTVIPSARSKSRSLRAMSLIWARPDRLPRPLRQGIDADLLRSPMLLAGFLDGFFIRKLGLDHGFQSTIPSARSKS